MSDTTSEPTLRDKLIAEAFDNAQMLIEKEYKESHLQESSSTLDELQVHENEMVQKRMEKKAKRIQQLVLIGAVLRNGMDNQQVEKALKEIQKILGED